MKSATKIKSRSRIYQLKITLRGSKPPIWRRFTVPGDVNLEALHQIIQAVMGWSDSHLHAFEIDGEEFIQLVRDGERLDMDGQDERKFRVADVIHAAGQKFRYVYDFGDGWEHSLLVEKILPAAETSQTIMCLAGRGRCPREDCGGIWGYYRMLKILGNPDDPEYADMMEWAGGKIDPHEFDLNAVDESLATWR